MRSADVRRPALPAIVLAVLAVALLIAVLGPSWAVAAPATTGAGSSVSSRAGSPATTRADTPATLWLCRPGLTDDPCRGSLTTTTLGADGSSRVQDVPVPKDPPVDCFYVYPTVSNEAGPNASLTASPEVRSIATFQAQRFSSQCRVFAPVYRQGTLAAILYGGFSDASRAIAYDDVRRAFRDYLQNDNGGRGIVLLGHSQGSGVLRRLIRDEIDGNAALRSKLVSAILLGGNVTVKRGSDRDGDFRNVPVCTTEGQAGCVIAYSSFNRTPPADAMYGRPPTGTDRLTGQPARTDVEVACVNPASIARNDATAVTPLIPSAPFAPGLISVGIGITYGGPPPTAATPWVRPPGTYVARCERVNGAHVLMVTGRDGAKELNPYPVPTWGTHLVDVNGAFDELQRALGAQVTTYLRPVATPATTTRRPRVALGVAFTRGRAGGRACAAGSVRLRVDGTDRSRAARVDFRVAGRRVARDRTAPFVTTVARTGLRAGRSERLEARVVLRDGRTRTLSRTVRVCPAA